MPRFGGLGSSFGRLGAGGKATATDPLAPSAPTVDLAASSDTGSSSTDDITSDTTPTITLTPGSGWFFLENDVLTAYVDGVAQTPYTITASDELAGTVNLDLSALSTAAHTIQFTHARSGHTSARGTLFITVVASPTLSSPSGAQLAQTTSSLSVSTNNATGTLYYVVTTSATPPSAAQVKAGQNDTGAAALYAGSQAISSTGTKTATATGVTVGTRYAYFMHENVAGGQSSVSASSSWSQADITAPVLSSPSGTQTGSTTADLAVSTDEGNGTLYGVLTASSTAPTKAQVKAGQDHTGASALYSFNQSVSGTGSQTKGATGLTAATTYYAHFMHEDSSSNQSTVASASSFTTTAGAYSPADLGANLKLWIEADDLTTMFQTITGTTAVASDGDVVGTWNDKSGNGFNLTATGNDGTRPTYNTSAGLHWVTFDGTDAKLRRLNDLGIGPDGQACSVFIAMKSNSSAASQYAYSCGRSSINTPVYTFCVSGATNNRAEEFLRNDASGSSSGGLIANNTYDQSVHVHGATDDGAGNLVAYLDGTQTDTATYTTGTTTLDQFAIGCLLRSSASNFLNGRIYALVVVDKVLSAGERGDLVTYLGDKVGLTL